MRLLLVVLQGQVTDGYHAYRGAVLHDGNAAHRPLADEPGGLLDVIVGAERG
jgi:hypothetical protein